MRPIRSGDEVLEGSLVEKQILAAAHAVWNMWEIHTLMLLSLSLQVFLFLTAGLRRRSTSLVVRTVLWLAYLSADAVAIFVLGHLAVRASEPRHQLMSFWAPFVLVHLGGQDTITAFSKQDNELWRRHLLNLVTQVAIAGYVVAKASWPDRLLRSAMALMFVSGCFKYAERTLCLFIANPAMLRQFFTDTLPSRLGNLQRTSLDILEQHPISSFELGAQNYMRSRLNLMTSKERIWVLDYRDDDVDIMAGDVPSNVDMSILAVNSLPGILMEFRSSADPYGAYEFVGMQLVTCYNILYTKFVIRRGLYLFYTGLVDLLKEEGFNVFMYIVVSLILLYSLLQYFSAPIGLVLLMVAEKGDQLHQISRTDITVSYILLVGAIVLDFSSATMFLLSMRIPSVAWSRKQWSEKLGQYSMIKRHVVQDTTGVLSSIKQWIGRKLRDYGVDLLELTHTPITDPIKHLILDNLVLHGIRGEWHVASSRGLLAVQNWIDSHQDQPASIRAAAKELEKAILSVAADFPTAVLIWHLATDICYYHSKVNAITAHSSSSDKVNKDREVSRQLSNYIMYLVFKCGVKLTPNSQHVHDKAHREIKETLSDMQYSQRQQQISGGDEQTAFMKIFEAIARTTQQRHEEPAAALSDTAAINHVQKLVQSAKALQSPVLPRACEVAQRLISINEGEADRWGLITSVWSEMLYYLAPRCGGAFHYEHLSTGGEFATHVLALMGELGPFMPPSDAAA